MQKLYSLAYLKNQGTWLFFLLLFLPGIMQAQVTVNATGGSSGISYTNLNLAFSAINAGTHSGAVTISINSNTTEPATPIPLNASGQSTTNYTSITIKPTTAAIISGNMIAGRGVIEFLGSDNVTIDGSITSGGTTRDLTIQNTNSGATTSTVVRLLGPTTGGLGATNNTIKNCKIIGASSTTAGAFGIHAGSTTPTTAISTSGTGNNIDYLTIENNEIRNSGVGVYVKSSSTAGNEADNLIIKDNDIHTLMISGIQLSYHISPTITNNHIFNIKGSTTATTTAAIHGISLDNKIINAVISYNEIHGIHHNGSGGLGSYGIDLAGPSSTNFISNGLVHHNVIYDINTVAGNASTSQTADGAFGIRVENAADLQLYYNSVHLFGSPVGGTSMFNSSALMMTTNNASIKVQNNIFSNNMTKGTASDAVFSAIALSPTQTFAGTTINNNGYFIPNLTNYHLARRSSTAIFYTTLADWQAYTTTTDDASYPSANQVAPFTSNTDLTIPASTVTPLESGGTAINAIGIPNLDFEGESRPKTYTTQVTGVNIKPDIGAFEFNGGFIDFVKPVIGTSSATPALGVCSPQAHVISAPITDASSVLSATVKWKVNNVAQTNISMTNTSGNLWQATIPVQGNNLVEFYIEAIDNSGNANTATSNTIYYRDQNSSVNAGPDKQSTTQSSIVLTAENFSIGSALKITEVLQYKVPNTPAEATYASFIPGQSTAGGNEFIEVSNTGDLAIDVSGFLIQLVGAASNTFEIPTGTIVPPGQVLTFSMGGTTSDASNLYFDMGITPSDLGSGSAVGYILKNNRGRVLDVVGTNSLAFSFLEAAGVTTSDWPDIGTSYLNVGSSVPGVQRIVDSNNNVVDTNSASDWIVTVRSTGPAITIGSYNGYAAVPTSAITWSNGTNGNLAASSTGKSVTTPVFNTPGIYTYIATATDGSCTVQDEITITVTAPMLPEAEFSAAPTTTRTGETVIFTDESLNTPGTWSWTFTGPGTATYLNGSTNTSQNPEVSFNTAGSYTVQLVASNGAGADTIIKAGYITVYWNYCTAVQSACGTAADARYIQKAELNTLINDNSGCSNVNPSNAYSSYLPSAFTTTLMKANAYSLKVTTSNSGTNSSYIAAWIDFNNNGTFETTEFYAHGTSTSASIAVPANTTVSIPITVPLTSVTGPIGMRIRLHGQSLPSSAACTAYTLLSGETEDYIITIVERPATDAGIISLVSPLQNACADAITPVIVKLQNFGTGNISNIPVTVNVTGAVSTTLSATYTGTLLPGGTVDFTVDNLNTLTGGTFNLNAFTGVAGDGDASNNAIAASRNINTVPAAPTTAGATFCAGSNPTLTASGTGTLRWYDQATGGTLLATGTSYTPPALTGTTNYYVEAAGTPADKVGLTATATAVSAYASGSIGYGINFTANQDIVLKGVYVYVKNANSQVIIQLRSGTTGTTTGAAVLLTAPTVTVANAGEKTYIPLNFAIPAGSYRLTSGNTTLLSSDSYPANSAVIFPFNSSNNEITIISSRTGSNITSGYYNFYDWDIQVVGCPSARTMVTATMGDAGQWTGTTSTDWNVASNWSCNTVPTATTNVSIPGGLSNYPQLASGTAQANNLTVASGASITINGGALQLAGNLSNSGTFSNAA
ncbi:lamin tail domain-containing protein, partial [Adhaeribacter sp. BT258]